MILNNKPLTTRLILSIISGALVIPLSYLESFDLPQIYSISMIDILIGTTFALLVMVPFQKRIHWLKIILMVVASIAIYVGVANLAVTNYKPLSLNLSYTISIITSGILGAILTGLAVQFIAPMALAKKAYVVLIIAGLFAGWVFSYTIQSSNIFINAIGFIVWQTMVCFSIYSSKK
jgi:hypothetical protein